MSGELLFNIGLIVMVVALAGGILAFALLRNVWTRLQKKLDAEYGKRRH